MQATGDSAQRTTWALVPCATVAATAKRWAIAAFLCCTAVALAGCALSGGSGGDTANVAPAVAPVAVPGEQEPVKVALLLPLSGAGETARVAASLRQAGELALFELDSPDVQLMVKDTNGTPEGATAAATQAAAAGAELVLGPLLASSVTAASNVTRAANIPMVAFSNDRSVAGGNVYLLSFVAGADVDRAVSYAVANGKRRFIGMVPSDGYGQIVSRALQDAVSRRGAELVLVENFPRDANGMIPPFKRAKSAMDRWAAQGAPVDTLFIAAGQGTLSTVATILPYVDIDLNQTQLLGTGDWDHANIGQDKQLVGGWFPAPDPQGWRSFTARYMETYGALPPRIASIGYDAVSLAISLSNGAPVQRYSAANLTRPSGFAGIDGLFRLTPSGVADRGLAILEVQAFGPRVLDPAPPAFGGPRPVTGAAYAAGSNVISQPLGTVN